MYVHILMGGKVELQNILKKGHMNPKKSYKISAVQKIKNKINIKFIIQFINTLTHMNNTFI